MTPMLVMNVQTAIARADEIAATVTGVVAEVSRGTSHVAQAGARGLGRRGSADQRLA